MPEDVQEPGARCYGPAEGFAPRFRVRFLNLFFAIFEKMTTFAADSVVRGGNNAEDERESGERPELFLQL